MIDTLPPQSRKLAANFLEEAGVRCFESHEFEDWYEAIHVLLLESGVQLSPEVIRELFISLPEEGDDEIFELALKAYLIDKNLLCVDQVEGEGWDLLFSKSKEVAWVDEKAISVLYGDPIIRNKLLRAGEPQIGAQA